jgi:hypothetical protein
MNIEENHKASLNFIGMKSGRKIGSGGMGLADQ